MLSSLRIPNERNHCIPSSENTKEVLVFITYAPLCLYGFAKSDGGSGDRGISGKEDFVMGLEDLKNPPSLFLSSSQHGLSSKSRKIREDSSRRTLSKHALSKSSPALNTLNNTNSTKI